MPTKAKVYIGVIVVLGFSLLTGVLSLQPRFPDLPRYLSYLLLALLASTMKVRLPGITGTISVNFLFILIGIANFTLTRFGTQIAEQGCHNINQRQHQARIDRVDQKICPLEGKPGRRHSGRHRGEPDRGAGQRANARQ